MIVCKETIVDPEPRSNDVVFGEGGYQTKAHDENPGNIAYVQMCFDCKDEYNSVTSILIKDEILVQSIIP